MPKTPSRVRALTLERLMSVERIVSMSVAPDGGHVALATIKPDLRGNRFDATIHVIDIATGKSRNVTPGRGKHRAPAWSPDGRSIAFVSDRDDAGAQIWILPVDGGEAHQLTDGDGGARCPVWAPDSRRIAFTRRVVVSEHVSSRRSHDSQPTNAEVYGLSHPGSSAQIADSLLFRHWDRWVDKRRDHVMIVDVKTGATADATPHDRDAPPISLGSDQDYAFSPDGRELVYVANPDAVVARSTNNCIFVQRVAGVRPVGKPVNISNGDACDRHPRYTADGASIVYLSMAVPGYEADRSRLEQYDRQSKSTRTHLERFDRSPRAFELDDAGGAVFSADDRGRHALFRLDLADQRLVQLTDMSHNAHFALLPAPGTVLATRESTTDPAELNVIQLGDGITPDLRAGPPAHDRQTGDTARALTHFGKSLRGIEMHPAEEFWYPGAGKHPVHGFLVRPPGFNPRKKHPLILLIHGGPQSAFMDHFHYRWSSQLFASRGAVVAFVNPRGSTGYGQKFTDQICRDWGGRCYEDIMRGVDHVLEHYPFVDGKRMAAAGASFGGFMVNWIAGHTDRFKALVCHDGIFHAETMAYTTEELWFDEYEHGGLPHEKRQVFLKHSPHMFVDAFQTPTLVIHGGLDYRCPISEGIGMFTALQVKGVPSRFVHFPDEGHWILKVANGKVWYDEVLGWIMKYVS